LCNWLYANGLSTEYYNSNAISKIWFETFISTVAKIDKQYITYSTLESYSETCAFRTRLDQSKCPDYQGVLIFQVSLHVNGYFGTITKYPDYGGVPIFKCPD